jgi:deazaflavin-dependent oxidoreductase (nitroreductase family)
MTDRNAWNMRVIEEFRTNGGKVKGPFEGTSLLLLTTRGAKSGQPRTLPLMYLPDSDRLVIFASKAGAPTNPDWYHNLIAHPQASVEVGNETFEVNATVANGEEQDRLYARQAEKYPQFAEYQTKTTRKIPVIILERRTD